MMRKCLAFGFCLLLAGLACLARAQPALQGFPPGVFQNRGALDAAASPSFAGPGDAVGSTYRAWGAEAYTAAYATGTGKAFNVCLAGDSACGDLLFGADGAVVDSTIGGSLCSAVTCTIKTAYNHVANGTDDLTNVTEATRPTISFNCQNGRACMVFTTGNFLCKSAWNGGSDLIQAYTISTALKDTGSDAGTNGSLLVSNTSGSVFRGFYSVGPTNGGAFIYSGGAGIYNTATANVWNAFSGVFNGGTLSDLNINGTSHTGDAGSGALFQDALCMGTDQDTPPALLVAQVGFVGLWASALSGPNSASLSSNYHTFWGF